MSVPGHSLQIVGRRKSVHVRNAPKATVSRQSVVRRDGPDSDMGSRVQRARLSIVLSGAEPTRQLFFPVQRFREGAYAIDEKLGRPIQRPIFYGDDPNIEPRIGKFHW